MELDGPGNRPLWKGIQSTVRTVTRHVARNIPKCTFHKLIDEQRVSIKVQVRKVYPILHRYRGDWGLNEMIMRTLTNDRDLQARIEKAGGAAGWSEKLKEQREARKTGTTGKGKGKACAEPGPSNATGDETPPQAVTPETDDEGEPSTSRAKASTRLLITRCNPTKLMVRQKPNRRIQSSEDEGNGDDAPAPTPKTTSKPKKDKNVSKRAPEVTSADAPTNDDQPTLVLESPPQKQKETGAFKDPSRSRKNAKKQLIEEPQGDSDSDEPALQVKPSSNKPKDKRTKEVPLVKNLEANPDSLKKRTKDNKANPPARSTRASSTPPPPATNVTDVDEGSTQSTQPYPDAVDSSVLSPPLVASGPAPTSPTHKGREAESNGSEEEVAMPQPARKRAPRSPSPIPSPIGSPVVPPNGRKRKAPPPENPTPNKKRDAQEKDANRARATAKPPASDRKAGGSNTKAGTGGTTTKRGGRRAKQELVDAADLLQEDRTLPLPQRTTRRTAANRA
ncbi:unnamed protein product [Rhizoctonia solani]|uniref:Uncharacterized protein n=1 Tax=Rhizoctonia solani TaxID=456999 RepID=A0A8H3CK51_9AGAM|nr:unnamed protein product [Rhizoctonia solani]